MSGRSRKGLSPSLFPFLAVLVCTLGTLILLLALVAENASTSAQAQADAAKEKQTAAKSEDVTGLTTAQASELIEEGEFRVEQLVSFRDQQTADLEERRSQLTQVESHMEKIREQLKQLNSEVDLALSDKEIEPIDDAELLTLRHRLLQEEEAVNKLRADKSDQIPRVALIPHKGPNGTDRRPVYLECTTRGMTIWPEGSTITSSQLEESVTGANPLDDALRVIRHHAMHQYGDVVPPYPLLVVRPDGIEAYASARSALRDWDDQFGYELVPAGVKLAYDKPDPRLKRRVDEVIRAAVIKQHGLTALAKRAGGKRSFNSDGRRAYPRLSAASMDRAGRASGFQDHREGFSRQSLRTMQANSARSYSEHASTGHGADVAAALDEKMKGALEGMRNDSGTYGSPGEFTNNPYAPNPNTSASIVNQTLGDRSGDGHNPSSERLGNGLGTSNSDFEPEQIAEFSSDKAGDKLSDQDAAQTDTYAGPKTNKYLVPSTRPDDSLGHQYNPHMSGDMGLNSPAGSETNAGSGNSRVAQNTNAARDASQSGDGGKSNASVRPSANSPSAQTQASQSQSSSQQRSQNQSSTREMVRRQGANWALPNSLANRSGNAIVRTIRVQCHPDRLVLVGSSRGGATEVFGILDTDMNRATIELASAVRDRIERWGAALPGGRWQPRLDVEVMPGATERFYQLKKMMAGGGLDIQGRPAQ